MRRIRLSTLLWATPFIALLLWIAISSTRDDDVLSRRSVLMDAQVDLGPYRDTALRQYRVRSGDTLGHIAQREVGSVRHVAALRRWNPTVKATALRVGQRLRLPPTDRMGEDARAFFAWRLDAMGRGTLQPLGPDDARVTDLTHGFILLSVPLDRAREAELAWREAEAFSAPLPHVDGTSRSVVLAKPLQVVEEDLTERALQTVSVERIGGTAIHTAATTTALDGKGRTIAAVQVQTHEWTTLWMTVLGVIAAALLLFIGARRLERPEREEAAGTVSYLSERHRAG